MAQPQNNYTTLLISDPNGGQPQMIKVMSGTKIPLQLTTSSGSNTLKSIIKSSSIETGTIIQAGKLPGRQIIALPTKQNVQGIRGPMVVPVSSVQLKTSLANSGRDSIVSPMVIRAQTRPLASGNASHMPIHLPQINVQKQVNMATQGAVLQTQLKLTSATTAGPSIQPTTFALKTQSHLASGKPEFIFVQQKSVNNATLQQTQGQLQTVTHQLTHQVSKARISSPLPSPKPPPPSIPSIVNPPPAAVNPSKSIMNTSILDHSGSRKRHDFDFDYSIDSKRRKTEKGGKGLRHFSMKVCEKVQAKGTTSYNEVADELVAEFTESTRANSPTDTANYDQKNIRRRVYDALNVLMAMNIISKERKEIRWLGLPTNSVQECMRLQQERGLLKKKIKLKQQQLQDLILQQIAFKNLVERNRRLEREGGAPSPNAAIQLPFIIVNTSKKTVIDCSISNDKTEYLFNFNDTFEIHDDIEVLKRMGMALGLDKGACSDVDLRRAKSLVPKALERYVVELSEMGVGASDGCSLPDPPPPSLRTGLAQLDAAAGPPVSSIAPSSAASSSSYADDDDDDDTGFDSDELDLG